MGYFTKPIALYQKQNQKIKSRRATVLTAAYQDRGALYQFIVSCMVT